MYSGDTFFHLSVAGQTGLAMLSMLLAVATIWMFLRISSRFVLPVKVLAAIILFWLFVWLTPQIYYLYYLLLFDGLPLQSVVGAPPLPGELLKLVTFRAKASLSDHSKGLLFWFLIALSFRQVYRKRP